MPKAITLQQYTGASLLNARQLNLSVQLMVGERAANSAKPSVLTRHNVMELLNVIESLAMSSRVLFDGSIQAQDKEPLIANNGLYHHLLQPTTLATSEDWLDCCVDAATQSWLLIDEWLTDVSNWCEERPVNTDDAEKFCAALKTGLDLEGTALHQYALQIVQDLSFLGAKAVAGVLLAIPDEQALARIKTALNLVAKDIDLQPHFVAGLVNRFRVNFVNELASQHEAAYVAAPVIEGLKIQQNMLLWRYLGHRLASGLSSGSNDKAAGAKAERLEALSAEESQALNSFPYAYALLMNKRVKTPSQLLDLLFKVRDESLIKMQTTEMGNRKRYIHNFSEEEFLDTQRALFENTYLDFSNAKSSWRDNVLNVGRSCLPAILTVGSAGLGLVIPDSVMESAAATGMASAGLFAERNRNVASASPVKKVKLYRDNYMKWEKLLDQAVTGNSRNISLIGRVEDLFDVKVR
ncbi:hypothetical protein CWE08_09240 [Aliidiomarina iranensis]|uniref:Uncharacterized protein n=1 Tax=Aliidiomarina iranensis TaxID=1434071 RepID=A0A432VT84_9GAMM|nr:hypothetical protein [Aliidiomarina iranensis]RUO19606.1 hypothetical protein CWE08_09240 [Aliidiomarina iranensis]